jgi:hypothetical protein
MNFSSRAPARALLLGSAREQPHIDGRMLKREYKASPRPSDLDVQRWALGVERLLQIPPKTKQHLETPQLPASSVGGPDFAVNRMTFVRLSQDAAGVSLARWFGALATGEEGHRHENGQEH